MPTIKTVRVSKAKFFAFLHLVLLVAFTISVGAMRSDATNEPSVILSGLTLNGQAQMVGSRLRLTDGGRGEIGSAFLGTRVNVQTFTNDFSFQLTDATGDGFTFIIQGASPRSLGGGGKGLGYSGIGHSVAIKFDLYDNAGEGSDSTGLYINGAAPTIPSVDLTETGIRLHGEDTLRVYMVYDGATLVMRITDTNTGKSFLETFVVDIPNIIGAPTAYVGFAGSTGWVTATQDILTWTYVPKFQTPATPAVGLPQITTSALPTGVVKLNYNAAMASARGLPPYTWGILAGQLPPGLSVQASTGNISGLPTQAGSFSFSVQVTDSFHQAISGGFNINIFPTPQTLPATTSARLYVLNSGPVISIYSLDTNNFPLIKQITLGSSTEQIRGVVASKVDGMMYISYGCTAPDACTAFLMKFDLVNEQVIWNKAVTQGIDSPSITPDGTTLYMPTGEGDHTHSRWLVIDTATGDVRGSIDSTQNAPHNTIVNAAGTHVYMGSVGQDTDGSGNNYLVESAIPSGSIIKKIGPQLNAETRPFTIDAAEKYAYIVPTGLDGFEVGDINTGQIIYSVAVRGFDQSQCLVYTTCSHGISVSPNGREIYLVDLYNNYVHIFDVSVLPGAAPTQSASIPLNHRYTAVGPWVTHSRDGRFVFVGDSGDVIDTASRQVVGYLQHMTTTKVYTEIDFENGAVSFAPLSRSGVGY